MSAADATKLHRAMFAAIERHDLDALRDLFTAYATPLPLSNAALSPSGWRWRRSRAGRDCGRYASVVSPSR
jgi:hypothetical protein